MPQADLILKNARIYTVDSAMPWAEAVACAGGYILAVGPEASVMDLAGPHTTVLDMGGRLVLPGLIDAHVHFLQFAIRRHQVALFGVTDFEEVRRRIRAAVEKAAPGEWVLGWGWDEASWGFQPDRTRLDAIAPHTPVALARMDMHTWWVNSVALRLAGITAQTVDPPESRIERDAAGEPTGILREWNAIRLVEKHIPAPDIATLESWTRAAITEAHRLGLTGIHDQRTQHEGQLSFRLFHKLDQQGELKLRVHKNIAAEHLAEAAMLGLQPGFGNERLWIGHVKAFADGTMGSQTALMLNPYEDDPDNYGLAVTPADALWELAVQADKAGFPLSIHAIGDLAVREVIDVLSEFEPSETAAVPLLPHRIEHVQLVHPADLGRLSQHGIVASMQPIHLMTDWSTANRVWGQRARFAFPFRTLLDHGTVLVFGSDAPVAPLNPLLGIQVAVTRQDLAGQPPGGWYPEERISVAEAIRAYTLSAAYAAGKQHIQGSITPGKWADLTVLSHNLFEIPPAEIGATKVEMTIFAGEIVYAREGA